MCVMDLQDAEISDKEEGLTKQTMRVRAYAFISMPVTRHCMAQ